MSACVCVCVKNPLGKKAEFSKGQNFLSASFKFNYQDQIFELDLTRN